VLKDGRIDLLSEGVSLRSELMKMKWERRPGKDVVNILDPEKSPDFADCLVYFTWEDKKEFTYSFMEV